MSTNEQVRVEFLKKLDTKGLVDRLFTLENELEQAMLTESEYKYVHAHDFAGYNSDSRAVEEIMAALMPPADKKTVDQRKAWLTLQRKDNDELREATIKQHQVVFNNEQNHIRTEMINRKLENVRIVLKLKTQQIAFLASGFLENNE